MPNVTCGRITERSPSATAESISTPRFIGPGCMHDRIRLREREFFLRQTVVLEELARRTAAARPSCARSAGAASRPRRSRAGPSRMSWNTRTPIFSTLRGQQRLAARSRAPPACRASSAPWICERATRECSTSPTIATRQVGEVLLVVPDREHVEQALRRMRVAAVAGVDHVNVLRPCASGAVR